MKIIYTHPNLFLVEHAKNLLQDAGIPVELRNQYAAGGIGDIAPINAWPELWLQRPHQEDQAKEILAFLTAKNLDPNAPDEEWTCPHCQQTNTLPFLQCWACDAEIEA